jgi:hypothetical protein
MVGPPTGTVTFLFALWLLTGVFEDLEDLLDQGLAFLGRQVPGMDGLLVGLEVAEVRLLVQVPVYEAHDGINLLARETVATAC